jgi:N-methylhydantoinase A
VHFGGAFGTRDAPVVSRGDLGTRPRRGPLVIDEYDATCVVPPDFAASRDDFGNVAIEFVQ